MCFGGSHEDSGNDQRLSRPAMRSKYSHPQKEYIYLLSKLHMILQKHLKADSPYLLVPRSYLNGTVPLNSPQTWFAVEWDRRSNHEHRYLFPSFLYRLSCRSISLHSFRRWCYLLSLLTFHVLLQRAAVDFPEKLVHHSSQIPIERWCPLRCCPPNQVAYMLTRYQDCKRFKTDTTWRQINSR